MPDTDDKLNSVDVQSLLDRANTPSPGPALAAQSALREMVAQGECAFVDQVTYAMARAVVDTFPSD